MEVTGRDGLRIVGFIVGCSDAGLGLGLIEAHFRWISIAQENLLDTSGAD